MLKSLLETHVLMVALGILAAVAAGLAFLWAKHPFRWILALLAIGWVGLVATYDFDGLDLDPRLPAEFARWLRPWALVLGLIVLGLAPHLVSTLLAGRGRKAPAQEGAAAGDLESALDEIDARLSQARYDAGGQEVFLLLAREETLAADMVRASGMNLFAAAPAAAEAPVHAYASADGLFLSCSGAASWGGSDGSGTSRLERLCGWIAGLNPEKPPIRGVAVLIPLDEATSPEALKTVGPLRNDLQVIQAGLKVRCPVIAVFCLRDGRSGFGEFAARMPAALRNNRCGFSTPASRPFDHAVAEKGFRWFVRWLQSWSLSLMAGDYPAREGNAKLVELNAAMRRDLPALGTFVEAAFSTHARAEPVLVRGCYVALCGAEPADQAFVAGLLKGPKSKMAADAKLATWAREAGRVDRSYRRAALTLAAASVALATLVWLLAIAPRLQAVSPGASSGLGWLAWAGLGVLAATWIGVLLSPKLRRSRPPATP
ncbi:type VI secretion protein IcmF/TssM N-terminal domain-containing protein [Paludisphaera mucosa]|uniref:Type VI secretion protein IcmF/TssM N-terminal domain-containing protein n=1 Tax=Paludisphaera mucosa TaxID=3030827 RepID=A0ABT6FE27_9BACT|nr:type VI secretion protein IcmF/TssM N-terminal domain-containing protein [Paludisphaera mucosa]MDG3005792.1 type VI secretion protein IcmF/TssM N-terminal domain-containing protein [Paludisphaera mucosa]